MNSAFVNAGMATVRSARSLWGQTAFLRRANPRDWLKSVAVIAAFGTAGAATSSYGLYLDTDEIRCLPEFLYAAYPRNGEPLKRGDVVSFIASRDEMLGLFAGKRIAKIVMAMPGDNVVSNESGVYINSVFIASRSPISLVNLSEKGGEPISTNRMLGQDEIFVMGTMPRSFDSRYFGVIQASHVDKFVKPLL